MKIRWCTTFDKHGRDGETTLQFWNEEAGCWEDVPHLRLSLTAYEEEGHGTNPDSPY